MVCLVGNKEWKGQKTTDSIVAAILSTSWHDTVMQGEPQRRGSGLPGGNVLCRDA